MPLVIVALMSQSVVVNRDITQYRGIAESRFSSDGILSWNIC